MKSKGRACSRRDISLTRRWFPVWVGRRSWWGWVWTSTASQDIFWSGSRTPLACTGTPSHLGILPLRWASSKSSRTSAPVSAVYVWDSAHATNSGKLSATRPYSNNCTHGRSWGTSETWASDYCPGSPEVDRAAPTLASPKWTTWTWDNDRPVSCCCTPLILVRGNQYETAQPHPKRTQDPWNRRMRATWLAPQPVVPADFVSQLMSTDCKEHSRIVASASNNKSSRPDWPRSSVVSEVSVAVVDDAHSNPCRRQRRPRPPLCLMSLDSPGSVWWRIAWETNPRVSTVASSGSLRWLTRAAPWSAVSSTVGCSLFCEQTEE